MDPWNPIIAEHAPSGLAPLEWPFDESQPQPIAQAYPQASYAERMAIVQRLTRAHVRQLPD